MEDKLVTLAILTYAKAQILKNVLEAEGIEAYIHNVNLIQPVISSGVRVRIKESDLPHALQIIESSTWLAEDIVKEQEESNKERNKQKKVLIPVDFSDYSLKACQFGFSFAKSINAEVILLHAYFSPIYVPTIPYGTENFNFQIEREDSIKSMIETVHKELNKLSDTIKKKVENGEFPNIKYTCILRDGIPEEEILRYAKEYKPQIMIAKKAGLLLRSLEFRVKGYMPGKMRTVLRKYGTTTALADKSIDLVRGYNDVVLDMGSIVLEKGVEYQLYFAAANNFYPPSVDSSWVAANDCIDIAHGSAYYGDNTTLIFSGTVVLQET